MKIGDKWNTYLQIGPFGGLTLVESVHLTVQYRYPRTKKRRIRNKWSKRPENFRPREDFLYDQARGVVYAHPIVARRLKAALGPNAKAHASDGA